MANCEATSRAHPFSKHKKKYYRLKKVEFLLRNKRKAVVEPTIHQTSAVSKALLRKF